MRRSPRRRAPTIGERLVYAFIGLVSGGLLSVLTLFPLFRLGVPGLLVPCAFSGLMAVWGFIGTESMTDQLGYWWDQFMSSRGRW